jgi:hypothetical protein
MLGRSLEIERDALGKFAHKLTHHAVAGFSQPLAIFLSDLAFSFKAVDDEKIGLKELQALQSGRCQ